MYNIGLILDSSNETPFVCLTKNGEVIVNKILDAHTKASALLHSAIQDVLTQEGLFLQHLNYIGIGIGPGSYTGTRSGTTTAKTLAFALGIPLVPFSSPLAFIPVTAGRFAHIMHAKDGMCHLLTGTIENNFFENINIHPLVTIESTQSLAPFSKTPPSLPVLAHTLHREFLLGKTTSPTALKISYLRNPADRISILAN